MKLAAALLLTALSCAAQFGQIPGTSGGSCATCVTLASPTSGNVLVSGSGVGATAPGDISVNPGVSVTLLSGDILNVGGSATGLVAEFGTSAISGTTTPALVSFGGSYGTGPVGTGANLKWLLYDAGNNLGNSYGIGMSPGLMELISPMASSIGVYPAHTLAATFTANGVSVQNSLSVGGGAIGSNTALFQNTTPTTGVTGVVCEDGAGQSTTPCFQVKNASGTTNASITGTGLGTFANLTMLTSGVDSYIKYNLANDGLEMQPTNSNTNGQVVIQPSGSATGAAVELLDTSIISSGSRAGAHTLGFGGGFGGAPSNAWSFGSVIYATPNANAWPLAFVTSNTSSGRFTAMSIVNTGDVLIGTGTDCGTALCATNGTLSGNLTLSGTSSVVRFTTIYSAAGTPLPSCTSGISGATALVSDSTLPAIGTAYTSGGAVFSGVLCDGSTTTWRTY